MMTPLGIEIAVGQRWKELDIRVFVGRVIEVVSLSEDGEKVYIRNVATGHITSAKLSRFNGKRSGYGLFTEEKVA